MISNTRFNSLLNKYAILLAVGYILTYVLSGLIPRLFLDADVLEEARIMRFLYFSSMIVQFIINAVAAVLISKDLKQLSIKNNLIVLVTLLFSLIGITMFFITVNNRKNNAST